MQCNAVNVTKVRWWGGFMNWCWLMARMEGNFRWERKDLFVVASAFLYNSYMEIQGCGFGELLGCTFTRSSRTECAAGYINGHKPPPQPNNSSNVELRKLRNLLLPSSSWGVGLEGKGKERGLPLQENMV